MIEIYTDGATNESSKRSGAGIYLKLNGKTTSLSIPLPYVSNHDAEFLAVIEGLEYCAQHYPDEIISIRTDSQIVVDLIENKEKNNKLFAPYMQKIRALILEFPYVFSKWIPSAENYHADKLAKEACEKQKNNQS